MKPRCDVVEDPEAGQHSPRSGLVQPVASANAGRAPLFAVERPWPGVAALYVRQNEILSRDDGCETKEVSRA
jgi:hypothetical protein